MKITIEVPDTYINIALSEPHSRYWASEARWDTVRRKGYVIERETNTRHDFGQLSIANALIKMSQGGPSLRVGPALLGRLCVGDTDGPDGDKLLQLAALGELRY